MHRSTLRRRVMRFIVIAVSTSEDAAMKSLRLAALAATLAVSVGAANVSASTEFDLSASSSSLASSDSPFTLEDGISLAGLSSSEAYVAGDFWSLCRLCPGR